MEQPGGVSGANRKKGSFSYRKNKSKGHRCHDLEPLLRTEESREIDTGAQKAGSLSSLLDDIGETNRGYR